ncbi:MAG TPA: hypothetical protein PKA34_20445 [Blastocatellia bacterium]|nr:hypothetical protein [Blastocatellia bacterium]
MASAEQIKALVHSHLNGDVDFTLGISSQNAKTDKLRVRCVRGGN